jgi:hypothetical protein
MNAKRPFRVIRVFDYPRWPRSTLPRIIGIVLCNILPLATEVLIQKVSLVAPPPSALRTWPCDLFQFRINF